MGAEQCVRDAGAGFYRLGGITILDDYRLQHQLEQLWNPERCPALSRERRVELIIEAGKMLASIA